jgi:hypothetical protein
MDFCVRALDARISPPAYRCCGGHDMRCIYWDSIITVSTCTYKTTLYTDPLTLQLTRCISSQARLLISAQLHSSSEYRFRPPVYVPSDSRSVSKTTMVHYIRQQLIIIIPSKSRPDQLNNPNPLLSLFPASITNIPPCLPLLLPYQPHRT